MRVCCAGRPVGPHGSIAFFCTRRTAVPPGRLFRTEAPRERQGRCGLSELCLQRPAVRPWWHGRIEPDFFIEDRRTLRDTNLADNEPVGARDHAYVAVVSTAQRAYDVAEVTRIGRHCGRLALHEVVQFVVALTNRTLWVAVFGRGSSSGVTISPERASSRSGAGDRARARPRWASRCGRSPDAYAADFTEWGPDKNDAELPHQERERTRAATMAGRRRRRSSHRRRQAPRSRGAQSGSSQCLGCNSCSEYRDQHRARRCR